jgi:hypothetical protein
LPSTSTEIERKPEESARARGELAARFFLYNSMMGTVRRQCQGILDSVITVPISSRLNYQMEAQDNFQNRVL